MEDMEDTEIVSEVKKVACVFSSEEMRKKEADFDKLALEIFSHYRLYEHVDLIAPYVLVRILPKDMYVGNIYIPDRKETNKPTWEGIVLRTWKPRNVPAKNGVEVLYSELSPGDHVLFPHYAGQPIPGLDCDVYRAIPEGVTKGGKFIFGNDVGVIFAKLDYQRESVEEVFEKVFGEIILKSRSAGVSTEAFRMHLQQRLFEEFDITVKVKGSRTLSGR